MIPLIHMNPPEELSILLVLERKHSLHTKVISAPNIIATVTTEMPEVILTAFGPCIHAAWM